VSSPPDFNQEVIAEFRPNHGRLSGNFAGAPVLLLRTVAARSGWPPVNPVMYLEGNRYLVFASKGRIGSQPRLVPGICGPTPK
jgi:F420H(2)-dependent quinone reductase